MSWVNVVSTATTVQVAALSFAGMVLAAVVSGWFARKAAGHQAEAAKSEASAAHVADLLKAQMAYIQELRVSTREAASDLGDLRDEYDAMRVRHLACEDKLAGLQRQYDLLSGVVATQVNAAAEVRAPRRKSDPKE